MRLVLAIDLIFRFINPATIQIAFRASGMARIKASLAGKGGSLGKSENAESGHS